MVQTVDQHLNFNHVAQIQNIFLEPVGAAPGSAAAAGQGYWLTTDSHIHFHDGTTDQSVAWLTDLGIQIVQVTADPGVVPAEPYFQYNTANNEFKYSDGTALQQIWTQEQGKVVQQLAANPTSAAANEGDVFYNSTANTMGYDDGTAIRTLATTDQITTMFRTRHLGFDATTGLPTAAGATILPGDALQQGDVFWVGTGGTIAGIVGADTLEVGDALVLGDAANPTVAGSWFSLQANLDIPSANLLAFENQTVNLTAATDATATFTVITGLQGIQVYDNANKLRPFIDATIATATTATINSLNAITGARVFGMGTV